MLIFILLLLFFICHFSLFKFFLTSSLTLPWPIARFLDHFELSAQPITEWFVTLSFFNHSLIFLPQALQFWVGIFYPQAFFTLHSFPTFWYNLFLSRFHWQPVVAFLKFARLHTDPWNTDPAVCLIHSNPQSSIHLKFVFINVIIAKVLLVVKTLIKKYIDQQPN